MPEITTRRMRTTLILLYLAVFMLPPGAEPATRHLRERGADAQAETQADLARPPEGPAEHVRIIEVCSGEHEASVGIAFMMWPSQHKGVYGRYHLEEHMVDWPPLVIVNYDRANEEITHTFFRGRNWTNEEFLRAFPKPCAILGPPDAGVSSVVK